MPEKSRRLKRIIRKETELPNDSCLGGRDSANCRCGRTAITRVMQSAPVHLAHRASGCAAPSICFLNRNVCRSYAAMILAKNAEERQPFLEPTLADSASRTFMGFWTRWTGCRRWCA